MSERPTPEPIFYARPVRTLDGDTIRLEISRWHGDSSIRTIRLLGVDAPEAKTPTREAGVAAREFVNAWLPWVTSRSDHTWTLVVQTAKADSFGRLLGRVWRLEEPEDLSTILIQNGHGVARSALAQLRDAR